jgi:hypothetical protein
MKSIYRNDIQIAKVDKAKFHLFERDTIYIDCNNDENELLLIGLTLTFDMGQDNNGSTLTFDFGNIAGPQAKKFNKDWKPK